MAVNDKNILIVPNIGSTTADPRIVFSGADASTGAQNITLQVYPTNSGTLSFEGSAGQLFSITNSMSGTIYSVNDVSGIPSIEVLDTGLVKLAQYSGNVLIGTGTDNGSKLQVSGNSRIGRDLYLVDNTSGSYGNRLVVGNTDVLYSLQDSNLRPTIQAHGAYPVISLNHTVTSNGSHGGTVQFTSNGTGNQFVIGMNGTGTQLDIGTATGNSWNPHNGIANYNGTTGWRMDTSGNVYNYVSSRAPIFYDTDNTGYYVDPTGTSNMYYISASRVACGYDAATAGSVSVNNWFRTSGANGLYYSSYARGVYPPDGTVSYGNNCVYGSGLNGWQGWAVNTSNNCILMSNASQHGLYNPASGVWIMVTSDAVGSNMTFYGNVTAYSDLRLKQNVREIDNVTDRRNALAKSAIKYERDGRTRIGYGAQILRECGCSEFVHEAEDDAYKLATGVGILSVDYGETTAVLAVASKQTDDRVAALEDRISQLEKIIKEML